MAEQFPKEVSEEEFTDVMWKLSYLRCPSPAALYEDCVARKGGEDQCGKELAALEACVDPGVMKEASDEGATIAPGLVQYYRECVKASGPEKCAMTMAAILVVGGRSILAKNGKA